jgi:hypothetical protein
MNFGFAILDFGLGSRTMRKTIWTESPSGSNPKSKIQNLQPEADPPLVEKWRGLVAEG